MSPAIQRGASGLPRSKPWKATQDQRRIPIQQPIANEAEADTAFDDITYQKGQSFLHMLENFLGEAAFRDGIRSYMTDHKYSNTTTADLWNSLGQSSGKPVGDIAAAWTEQPGFPVVKVKRAEKDEVSLTQERLAVHFPNAPKLEWKVPLTYFVLGEQPQSRLMTGKVESLKDIPSDRTLKLNAQGAGNYRVQYDDRSWTLLLASLPKLDYPDRVNLLCDSWALATADRSSSANYFGLVEKLPSLAELAEGEQVITVFDYINRLLVGHPDRAKFQTYARTILRPAFDQIGWDPKSGESPKTSSLRASLIAALGSLEDKEIVAGCREHFQKYLSDPSVIAPDLRHSVLTVVGRHSDESTWNKIHELGLKTTNIGEKQDYYDALAHAIDPKLVKKTLQIALTDELPTSRAIFLVGKIARYSDHPEIAWEFAKTNMKALLGKADALAVNSYAPSLFTFFSEKPRAEELKSVRQVQSAFDKHEGGSEGRGRS